MEAEPQPFGFTKTSFLPLFFLIPPRMPPTVFPRQLGVIPYKLQFTTLCVCRHIRMPFCNPPAPGSSVPMPHSIPLDMWALHFGNIQPLQHILPAPFPPCPGAAAIGFVCPVCGHQHCYAINGYRRFQCAKCRHQTSLTANTVMHRSHLPLHTWFWAIFLVVCDKRGISALALADKIEVCYETAWNLLRRIRAAMEMRDEHYVLGQIVEFDDAYFGAKTKGVRGRGAGNQGVFIAVAKKTRKVHRLI